ncbi:hypothetical protein DTW68_22620 [Vibrio harveyi]|nr:hypothetical protein DTW68_22620 [Vibrio harveyi]
MHGDIGLNIECIKLDLRFIDPDHLTDDKTKSIEFLPKNEINLSLDCPYKSCVDGGFDVSSEVQNLVKKRGQSLRVTQTCQGWQDRRRINKHRCLCEMQCDVTVIYSNT